MARQGSLLRPRHDSSAGSRKRLRKYDAHVNPERLYLATWKRWARKHLSTGHTMLEHILARDFDRPESVTTRDMKCVATFVQWLGTNVGMGFIREAERAIDAARDRSDTCRRRGNLMRDQQAKVERARRALARLEEQQRGRGEREIEV